MSHFYWDPDEWETVTTFTPCWCSVAQMPCNGTCSASGSLGQRPRPPEEVKRIRAEKRRAHEQAVLAEADAIRARGYQG